jgi:hypothetical protein
MSFARQTAAFALLAAASLPCAAQTGAPAAVHVAACGLEFDLPVGHKITRPKRSENWRGARECAFDIVPTKPAPPERQCKDEDEGGWPPYDVCDWIPDPLTSGGGKVWVARVRPTDLPLNIGPFVRTGDGQWAAANAQNPLTPEPARRTKFFGKPAWKGEAIVRLHWIRQRVKSDKVIYAGSGGSEVTLVQFAPDLLVALQDPPADADGGDTCQTFCASLRLGTRTQDLP